MKASERKQLPHQDKHIIDEYELIMTCPACPEQYDVLECGRGQVGYIRIRWGQFWLYYPDEEGRLIFQADISAGNNLRGQLTSGQRGVLLPKAIAALRAHTHKKD